MPDQSTPPPEPDEPVSDPDRPAEDTDNDVYDVSVGDDPDPELPYQLAGLTLPRRPYDGRRGVLLVDTDVRRVILLDADDDDRTFRPRAVRELAGDPAAVDPAPAGVDDVVRAAYEHDYDVIAAPWVGDDTDPESADAPPRKRGRAPRRGAS